MKDGQYAARHKGEEKAHMDRLVNPEPKPPNPNQPDPKLKGIQGGNCNREACQKPGAQYFNKGTRRYYCESCAHLINEANNEELCILKAGDFALVITRDQAAHLNVLNAVWDTLTTPDGLLRYRQILGREGLAVIVEAAETGRKVRYTVLDDAPEAEVRAEEEVAGDKRERFHAHLDRCSQCADHPFNLCPEGAIILTAAVDAEG